MSEWRPTACILCSQNCGLQVLTADGHLTKIKGDPAHPSTAGYACEKAQRLDHYQHARGRLTTPLRRTADGSFEPIDWDTAIREVAAALAQVRDSHGGETIFSYGGGGQGNHLGGTYGRSTRAALGAVYTSNALAQEKTGEFWVDGQLFGRATCHTTPDFEHAEVAIFVGKNPWQSHGLPRARETLHAIAKDPARTLVVIDPRRTETAALADVYLQVRPGTDAWCLSALLAALVEGDHVDRGFLAERTIGYEALTAALAGIDVDDYAAKAGLTGAAIRELAARLGRAGSVAILEDLGIQQAPHSTLSSYLEKLVYLITGNFGRPGTMNLHTQLGNLIGRDRDRQTPVGGHRIIGGMVPCNVIAEEILTDHPKRFRAMIVESANPAHSLAGSARMREALAALDVLVVIDVAMTETARLAHYVLPASSQFEKWEATFFNLEFPKNVFHLRAPLFAPEPGTLAEPEIHRRLVEALGAIPADVLAALHEAAALVPSHGRGPYAAAFFRHVAGNKALVNLAPVILYQTLGPTLPDGAGAAAVLWALCQQFAMSHGDSVRRAGIVGDGPMLGDQLFEALLAGRSGVVFSVDEPDVTWKRLEHKDRRIHLAIPELLGELTALAGEDPGARDPEFPFVLAAGERRTSTANTIFRDPGWRKKDPDGALRVAPGDAARLGLVDGGRARVTTRAGSVVTAVEITDTLQLGHVTLPNGFGLDYPDAAGTRSTRGVAPNELTSADQRDWIAGTPWHKHVAARVEPA